MRHSSLLATPDERVNGSSTERRRTIALYINDNGDVGNRHILFLILEIQVYHLHQDIHRRLQLVGSLGLVLYRRADDDVSSHLTGYVGRIVVLHATIHQHFVAHPDRREDTRYSHTGAHSPTEDTAMENVFGIVGNIGRHTSELDGKGIEVDGVVVRIGQTLQQLTDSDTREKTTLRS